METNTRILLAEDEEVIAVIIEALLLEQGYEVTICPNGQAAWDQLQKTTLQYDIILLDWVMPVMDGLALLKKIKSTPKLTHIPVIMETAMSDIERVREGLNHGAYYYLTKPLEHDLLLAVIRSALRQAREKQQMLESVRRAEKPLAYLHEGSFRFRTPKEGRLLANYLARACPEPERSIQGLMELLLNAIEHGNLGITYEEKSELLKTGSLVEEIDRRLQLPEYRDRNVEILIQRSQKSLDFTIIDQGNGFSWRKFMEFSPERAFDLHGRGIAMANKVSFDHLEYQGKGNVVKASLRLK